MDAAYAYTCHTLKTLIKIIKFHSFINKLDISMKTSYREALTRRLNMQNIENTVQRK